MLLHFPNRSTVPFPSTARDFVPQDMLFFSNKYADSIFSTNIWILSKYRTGSDHHQTDYFPTRSYRWLPSPNMERSASQASCWRPPSWRRRVVGSVPYNRQRLVKVLGGLRQGGDCLGWQLSRWLIGMYMGIGFLRLYISIYIYIGFAHNPLFHLILVPSQKDHTGLSCPLKNWPWNLTNRPVGMWIPLQLFKAQSHLDLKSSLSSTCENVMMQFLELGYRNLEIDNFMT